MSVTDRLDVLRERNKDLLNQLKQRRETLERLSGCSQGRKREREAEEEESLTEGDRGPARAAVSRPTVRFWDTCEGQTGIQHRGGTAEHTTPSHLFKDNNRHAGVHIRMQGTRPASSKSCLVNHSKKQREAHSRVTFESDEFSETPASDRHHLQPLLGYDWIAGVLDAEDSLIERSDEFFNDLRTFRSLNKDECVHGTQAGFSEENPSVLSLLTDKDSLEANTDTHQCTFSYRINSRLFPVPLHFQECCPVCKKHKSTHSHTVADPALIRVSIPRSALLPPYKYKAHRRCSFDPSDSLGLPSHCLSGWSNKGQSTLPPPSSLDLRSSLDTKNSSGSQNEDLEDLSAPKVSGNQISDQLSDVSRLARHNFEHFSPKRKLPFALV
ncbi:migration and invasion-inhibitory protein [Morone saxatilis]|uniref:migration and invasion-inhibitory protein n=1 Tax=Morone saxatilis TaxID=34816 RepID=UPI0015E24671|nr:migration and invasion-inhibitory protein [Morone saxatilis]